MKHPKDESWSDYVRGVAEGSLVESLQQHLGSGCTDCGGKVAALRGVERVARLDREFEVPVQALRAARNLFRVQRLLEKQTASKTTFRLAFDSLLAPAAAGVRNAGSGHRHLVFESDDLTVDLQIARKEDSPGFRVAGQVTDSQSAPIAEMPAFLYQGAQVSSQASSGDMGEFELVGDASDASRLCFLLEDERLVDLELPVLEELV